MTTPPTRASVKIVKSFTYRGAARQFSNRYFFGDLTSLTTTTFNNLADDIEAKEKAIMSGVVTWVEAVGYDAGSDVPEFVKSLSGAGSIDATGGARCPGDCAFVIRFRTDQRTSKHHPIYLFKYFHDVFRDTGGGVDDVLAHQISVANTFGGQAVSGFTDGSAARPISGPYGAVAQDHTVLAKIRHRDFPD